MSSTFYGSSICIGENGLPKLPEIPKDKCVLDFGKSEKEILKEITKIMDNESTHLEEQIQKQQEIIMNGGKPVTPPEVEKPIIEEPSSKELFEFKNRLEVWWYI